MTLSRTAATAGLFLALTAMGAQATGPTQTALFSGGCFWTMQHAMEEVPGVVSVTAGYAGGHVDNPSYEQVSTETTGHRETVRVVFDPARITYAQLVQRYLHWTDPTQADGQACDHGPSYTPAIFVNSPQQRAAAVAATQAAAAQLHRPIATRVLPNVQFWPAEGYHQDYARRNVIAYNAYRIGCGRDGLLHSVWGPLAEN
jgi:peptide-methionine (S)-S-oxide reductase